MPSRVASVDAGLLLLRQIAIACEAGVEGFMCRPKDQIAHAHAAASSASSRHSTTCTCTCTAAFEVRRGWAPKRKGGQSLRWHHLPPRAYASVVQLALEELHADDAEDEEDEAKEHQHAEQRVRSRGEGAEGKGQGGSGRG